MAAGMRVGGVPVRADEQRLRALEQANRVRSERARLKKELAAGRIGLVELLVRSPACVQGAKVADLLVVLPKIGSVRAGRILTHCRIASSKTVAGLSDRQRAELINLLQR